MACGGDCAADDANADGICDDEDPACTVNRDACGVCNGPGAIYECGCSDIPAGDCDCDGNQLDALGVCGGGMLGWHPENGDGDFEFDTKDWLQRRIANYDATTIADNSTCTYPDECGICDGPGAIYECGCSDIPAGDCDCNGNQEDASACVAAMRIADADNDGIFRRHRRRRSVTIASTTPLATATGTVHAPDASTATE